MAVLDVRSFLAKWFSKLFLVVLGLLMETNCLVVLLLLSFVVNELLLDTALEFDRVASEFVCELRLLLAMLCAFAKSVLLLECLSNIVAALLDVSLAHLLQVVVVLL